MACARQGTVKVQAAKSNTSKAETGRRSENRKHPKPASPTTRAEVKGAASPGQTTQSKYSAAILSFPGVEARQICHVLRNAASK